MGGIKTWQPSRRLTLRSFRPVALRPILSNGLPLSQFPNCQILRLKYSIKSAEYKGLLPVGYEIFYGSRRSVALRCSALVGGSGNQVVKCMGLQKTPIPYFACALLGLDLAPPTTSLAMHMEELLFGLWSE